MDAARKVQVQKFAARMIRAAKLDPALYKEVEEDQEATRQALAVVVLSGLATGFGTIGLVGGYGEIFMATVYAVLAWIVWAALTYWIGTRLLPEPQTRADFGQMLRVIGFASAPGVIRVLGILPGLTGLIYVVAAVWMLVAMVIAVRQALDFESTWRAVGVCFIGWVVQVLVLALVVHFALMGLDE